MPLRWREWRPRHETARARYRSHSKPQIGETYASCKQQSGAARHGSATRGLQELKLRHVGMQAEPLNLLTFAEPDRSSPGFGPLLVSIYSLAGMQQSPAKRSLVSTEITISLQLGELPLGQAGRLVDGFGNKPAKTSRVASLLFRLAGSSDSGNCKARLNSEARTDKTTIATSIAYFTSECRPPSLTNRDHSAYCS